MRRPKYMKAAEDPDYVPQSELEPLPEDEEDVERPLDDEEDLLARYDEDDDDEDDDEDEDEPWMMSEFRTPSTDDDD